MATAPAARDDGKALAHRLMDEIWSRGDFSVTHEIVSPDFINHDPSTPDLGRGPEAYNRIIGIYRNAMPDAQFIIDETIAEGDKVAVRYTCRGTHRGELVGIAPTGKEVMVTGILIFRTANGRIEEVWVNWDALGLLQQLGAVPAL